MKTILLNLTLIVLFSTACAWAQALVIPQIADGGGWASTVVLTNTTSSDTTTSVTFYQDTADGSTVQWTPPFLEVASTEGLLISAGSSIFLHTTGTAIVLTQGWAQLIGAGVQGYVIYTYTSGQSTSDATAAAVTGATRILVPFDNTGTLSTELAVVNPTSSQVSISVNLKTSKGVVTKSLLTMAGEGQMAFAMATQFPATAGVDGLAEFYANTGTFAIIALRSNNNTATGLFSFTSAQVYPETGPPII